MNWKKLLVLALVALCATYAVHGEEEDGNEGVEVEDEPEDAPVEPVRERPRYKTPVPKGNYYLAEPFDSKASTMSKWVQSQAKKDNTDEAIAKYDGKWEVEEAKEGALLGDLSLVLKSKAKHHAVSAMLDKPFEFKGKPFVVQYEVKFQNGIDCGGAYVKLLSKTDKIDLKGFHDKTPYTVMFGPDKCGMDHKLHFIFRHKNPQTGEFEEKHAKKPSGNIDSHFSDRKTHLYTLIVNPDNSFEIRVDNTVVNSGSLLADVSPAVNPPKEIDDPKDKKPETWDEREKIPDPDAKKPDDWDESEPATITDPDATKPEDWLDEEPLLIPDPDAEKPADWDDEMDGEWEAPKIDNPKCASVSGCGEWTPPKIQNPKYKGKWSAPMIDNPNYQGIWKPKRIPNPNYFEDLQPYKMTPISAVGLELWSMTEDILFDNFLVTDDMSVAEAFAADTWVLKHEEERATSSAGGVWQTLKSAAEERPWLWAVYVVVLLLPVVLLSICLCPKSGPVKPEDIAAERKKTDEATPDDEVEEEDKAKEEKDKEKDVGAGGDNATAPTRKSKAALEATEGDEDEAEDEGEEADAEDEEQTTEQAEKKSPRRRKPRKD